jgi:hypothetical protein
LLLNVEDISGARDRNNHAFFVVGSGNRHGGIIPQIKNMRKAAARA